MSNLSHDDAASRRMVLGNDNSLRATPTKLSPAERTDMMNEAVDTINKSTVQHCWTV
jgi:hypothetical protein